MTTLVTGGAGFVGQHLVDLLQARGEDVRVLDLVPPNGADFVQGSVTDPAAARKSCEGVSSVFHLAGNAQLWARDRNIFEQINFIGTKVMLEAAVAAGVKKFVHCSSLTTLVGVTAPIGQSSADETVRLDEDEMLGPYPRSKLLAERAVEAAAGGGLDAVIAIPTEPLGPGDEGLTPPTRMILDFLNGKTPAFIDCELNFVPVQSLSEGFIAARDKGVHGERYLLGGENIELKTLLSMLNELTGVSMPKSKLPYGIALAAGIVDTKFIAPLTGKQPKAPLTGVRLAGRRVRFSSEKAKNDLDWVAAPVAPTLSETINWFAEKGLFQK